MTRAARDAALRVQLEALYARFNRAEYIDPDPLAPVRRFDGPRDREIAGLIAAVLAFGNAKAAMASIARVLAVLPHPHDDLIATPPRALAARLAGFRHRFVDGAEMADLLEGVRGALSRYGSLEGAFVAGLSPGDEHVVPAATAWVDALRPAGAPARAYLLTDPRRGSACKRLFMYLRWMVRDDAVDLGVWRAVPPRMLVAPLDTHLFRVARALGLTRRKTPSLRAALEVTAALRRIAPGDPIRYDFALTRLGIHPEGDLAAFLDACRAHR